MKPFFFSGTTGCAFFLTLHFLAAQEAECTIGTCGRCNAPGDSMGDKSDRPFFLWRNASVSGGQITLPFKIRRSPQHNTFRLTTDVTLGGFIGYTRRISQKHDYFLTVPLTAGLTFINLSESNTSLDLMAEGGEDLVPGLTWSTGLVLQLDRYSLGLMFGKDYAGSVGDQWEYHGKMWWSFGVGFVFLQ